MVFVWIWLIFVTGGKPVPGMVEPDKEEDFRWISAANDSKVKNFFHGIVSEVKLLNKVCF